MSVVALVCEEEEARRVVTWAGRFAAAEKSELIVFLLATPQNGGQLPHLASTEEGIPRENDPVDVGIVIASERRLPMAFADELAEIVRTQMQNPELRVKVACVADGWDMEGVELGPNGTE